MKKKNGFTLVEILITIGIISIIGTIAGTTIFNTIKNSKETSLAITKNNILKSARTYVEEYHEKIAWIEKKETNTTEKSSFSCISINELINRNLIKKDSIKSNNLTQQYVIVWKNNNNVISTEEFDTTDNTSVCGSAVNIVEIPTAKDYCNVLTYNKVSQTLTTDPKDNFSFSNNKQTNAGTYKVTANLNTSNDNKLNIWSDGTTEEKYINCTIKKAKPVINIITTDSTNAEILSNITANLTSNTKGTMILKVSNPEYYEAKIEDDNYELTDSDYDFEAKVYKKDIIIKTLSTRNTNGTLTITLIPEETNNYYIKSIPIEIGTNKKNANINYYQNCSTEENTEYKSQSVTVGKEFTVESNTFECDGFKFTNWNEIKDGSGNTWEPEETKTYNRLNNTNLYAQWEPNTVNITYNPNGGTVIEKTNAGTWTTDTDNIIHLNGKKHITQIEFGKNIGENGLTDYYSGTNLQIINDGLHAKENAEWICLDGCTTPNKTFSQSATYSHNDFCDATDEDCTVVLGVNWIPNTVNIIYNVNGGRLTEETIDKNGKTNYTWSRSESGNVYKNGTILKTTIEFGKQLGTSGLNNYNNDNYLKITRAGYSAVNDAEWKCLNGCDKVFNQKDAYNANEFCDASNGDCTVVLGVNWISNTYTINYNANGGTGAPSSQTKTHNKTLTLSSTKPARNNETATGFTVTFDANDGNCTTNSLTATNTTTYSFKNWNTTSKGTGTSYSPNGNYTVNSNATLYAQWTPTTTNGSITLPTPTRTGYKFLGWNTDSKATTGITGTYTPTSNIILYAIWTPNKVNIIYNVNGGRLTEETIDKNGKTNYTWSRSESGNVYKNGTILKTTIEFGKQLGTSGLNNYNNDNYLKITRAGYSAISGAEWICLDGCTTPNKTFSQSQIYSHNDFCDATYENCTVILGVNWKTDEDVINGNRYNCSAYNGTYRLSIFNITTCNSTYCNYSKINGLTKDTIDTNMMVFTPTWTIQRNLLGTGLGDNCKLSLYVYTGTGNGTTGSGLNCRNAANADSERIYGIEDCVKINAYRTTTKRNNNGNNWYYLDLDGTNGCYLAGDFLYSNQQCTSSGGSSTGGSTTTTKKQMCGQCSSDSDCDGNMTCSATCGAGYSCCVANRNNSGAMCN